MPATSATRFVLIGGFLGAGKTTLVGALARRYVAQGKRVGIVTNDQAADLVDTHHLRSQGFDVGEVAGACFCCSFDNLLETAERLAADGAPDVILAEPVGSCTDLIATVVLPLQQMYGNRFALAPFGVLLKPSHGRKILDAAPEAASGFSPQAEYIFRKQLEEADFLMIGRSDQLSPADVDHLRRRLGEAAAGVPVVAVSPKTGVGVERVMELIDQGPQAGRRVLEIDYDRYAAGEAELGWVNMTATATTAQPIDLDALAADVVRQIAQGIGRSGGEIAHLKTAVSADGLQAVASVVSGDGAVDQGLTAGRLADGEVLVIINARVAVDPDVLEACCLRGLQQVAQPRGLMIRSATAHALRPGRPQPTHRLGV